MRIAFLTHQWPGARLGGIGAYTLHAAKALAPRHEIHIFTITLPADARQSLPPGLFLHEIPGLSERIMAGTLPSALGVAVQAGGEALHRLALACLLCEEVQRVDAITPFDIVEGPEYESLALPLALSKGRHIPTVTQIHSGSAIARDVGNLRTSAEQLLRETLELAAIQASDALCAPSHQVIADTRTAYAKPDIAANPAILPLPFDPGTAPFSPPPADGPILYVGRIEWLKGCHLLADAANIFLAQHPRATLRLAGPDTMTAPNSAGGGTSMTAWIRDHLTPAVRDRVTFLGELSREQIAAELAACSFFVAPSLRESYSYVCCEALAAGRPAVVSDQTGAAEVVGNAGLIFPRGNAAALAHAMDHMYRNHTQRDQMARLAWERARTTLSGNAVLAKRENFYQHVATLPANAAKERFQKLERADWIRNAITAIQSHDAPTLLALVADWGGIKSPGMRVVETLSGRKTPARFYLYGAGRHTARLLAEKSLWEDHGHQLIGLIDDHPRFKETPEQFGLPVISCATAAEKLGPTDTIILSTDAFEDQFWQQTTPLRNRGATVHRLYGK